MQTYFLQNLVRLMKVLGIVLALFIVSRILFFAFNQHFFESVGPVQFFQILYLGLRFDIAGVIVTNMLFILLVCLPFPFVYSKTFQKMLFILFVTTNSMALLLNSIDMAYFQFSNKRSTSDLFSYIFSSKDVVSFLPKYFLEFWFVLLIYFIFVAILVIAYKRIPYPNSPERFSSKYYTAQTLIFLFVVGLSVLGVRGGVQAGPPISMITAAETVGSKKIPLVTNTPFSFYRTLGKTYLEEKIYFTPDELRDKISFIHNYHDTDKQIQKKNVVIIILESFSTEYLAKPYGVEGLTPFLDSLIKKSLYFKNTFANARRSQDAIPSIVASIPSMIADNSYTRSAYASNSVESLSSVIGKIGYHTSFFHGGTTGTMGFNYFSNNVEFQKYFGMEDYPDKNDFDGNWGIYDEPFFQFFAEKLNTTQEPFFSVFFSLSSHHPFLLPEIYKNRFKEGKHPVYPTVQYTDHALKRFFEAVEKTDWYQNTVFIITADHTMYGQAPYYKSDLGKFAIPLLFFSPSDTLLKGVSQRVAQQLDIMPTILDYLNYEKPFFSFGKSLFENSEKGSAINYYSGIYQFIQGDYALQFNGTKSLSLYNFKKDILQETNLLHQEIENQEKLEASCKAFIQGYNHALLKNEMTVSGKGINDY